MLETTVRAAGIISLVVLLTAAPPAAAQLVPKCTAAKLKSEGKAAAKVLKCYARAAAKHAALDADCVQKVLSKLDQDFLKAEVDGPCYDGVAFRWALVSETEAGVAGLLYPTGGLLSDPQFDCAHAKLKAAARLASKSANCHAKAAKKATTGDPACLQKAASKFVVAFQDAETVGGCATNGNASPVATYVGQLVDSAVALLTADAVPMRCCAASATVPVVGAVSGCADLVLGRCTTAALLLSSVGGTATLGVPGHVCNGAAGACATVRTGASTCCEASKNGLQICAEGPSLGSCSFFNGQGGVTFTQHNGKTCKDDQYSSGGLPHCD